MNGGSFSGGSFPRLSSERRTGKDPLCFNGPTGLHSCIQNLDLALCVKIGNGMKKRRRILLAGIFFVEKVSYPTVRGNVAGQFDCDCNHLASFVRHRFHLLNHWHQPAMGVNRQLTDCSRSVFSGSVGDWSVSGSRLCIGQPQSGLRRS
jgi:hypothetical protein